ncbi:MAG: polysaccharide biosynthesis protein, partial [Calditrichia bacterium]|nr:polysaccharide biosynthesis protein [Calditrichia bacterium]
LFKANITAFFIFTFIYIFRDQLFISGLPKSVIVIEFITTIILSGVLRISKRLFLEIVKTRYAPDGKNTIIIGAGKVGEMVIRDLRKANFKDYKPVAILDDDPQNHKMIIHNVPVIGSIDLLEKTIKKEKPYALIIADQDISLKHIKNIYILAQKTGIKEVKRIPKMYDASTTEFSVKKLSELNIEDILKREEVKVDKELIQEYIKGKTVMITGAAGSIGSEICRQVSLLNPSKVILFEIDETEMFFLEKELNEKYPELGDNIVPVIGDVRDLIKLENTFIKYKPNLVFHTAAYKHVPLMEDNPEEAIKVNIIGTNQLCELASKYKVGKFINISTDKAVKPSSVMGASKRVGEYIARAHGEGQNTVFVSVRFGNVLGSRGSVLPIFLKQLENGGPITITDKEMRRYFMSIPEAVSLVLEAGLLGKNGEIMVLDMGEPIYIKDFAEELIHLHGLEPYKDIEIVYSGIRPGEKLFEELLTAEEGTANTSHERVFIANISKDYNKNEISDYLKYLENLLKNSTQKDDFKTAIFDFVYFTNKDTGKN